MMGRCCLLPCSILAVLLCSHIGLLAAATIDSSNAAAQNVERNLFAADVYQAIATEKLNDNVVISPAAIQTTMALAFYGAKGKTADELQTGLRLGSSNPDEVVRRFGEFQQTFTRDNNVRLATNFYINENLEFKAKFQEVAARNFDANVEKADFHPPYNRRTAERINNAMSMKTNGKIVEIIKAEALNDRTEGVVVNGITFTAPWQKAFKADKTTRRSFSTGGRQTFDVDTMWTLNNFKYAELRNLDAKAIELPYQNGDFAMIVLLPNKKDGLSGLISSLANKNLVDLLALEWRNEKVEVHLPKFSVQFGVSLEQPLKKLGVTTMFSRNGDFGNLYRMFVSHFISSAEHKAYVQVSEAGLEPSLETGILKNFFSHNKKFDADHPFVFAIKHKDSIIFMGHIANYVYA